MKLRLIFLSIIALTFIQSCEEDDESLNGTGTVSFSLTELVEVENAYFLYSESLYGQKRFEEAYEIFKIYDVGHDFSSEEFFRIISTGTLDVWITKPFVSLLNNQLSFSTSAIIEPKDGVKYILCLEVNYEVFRKLQAIT